MCESVRLANVLTVISMRQTDIGRRRAPRHRPDRGLFVYRIKDCGDRACQCGRVCDSARFASMVTSISMGQTDFGRWGAPRRAPTADYSPAASKPR
jgi:hypothetical protein